MHLFCSFFVICVISIMFAKTKKKERCKMNGRK